PKFGDEEEVDLCDAEFDGRGVRSMRAGGLAIMRHAREIEMPGCLFTAFLTAESGVPPDPEPLPDIELRAPICESGDANLIAVWKMAVRAELFEPGRFKFLDLAITDPRRR